MSNLHTVCGLWPTKENKVVILSGRVLGLSVMVMRNKSENEKAPPFNLVFGVDECEKSEPNGSAKPDDGLPF